MHTNTTCRPDIFTQDELADLSNALHEYIQDMIEFGMAADDDGQIIGLRKLQSKVDRFRDDLLAA